MKASSALYEVENKPGVSPVDMVLNHGTYCSKRCVEVLRRHDSTVSLRAYPSEDNADLRAAIARDAGVSPENVLVANGSGPLLKSCIPFLIEQKIKQSPWRMARFLLKRTAYPIITPRLTYSKVPSGGLRQGLKCELLPLEPESGFTLDLEDLRARLRRCDGLVYLSNPNNPTGNVLITPAQLTPLLTEFPESYFCIDEAYLQYLPNRDELAMTRLVPAHANLMVVRSFSFAYGLASVRAGYALMPAGLVKQIETKLTPHRVGQLAAELVMASLADPEHLPFVERETATQRQRLMQGMAGLGSLEAFPSLTNFILCRVGGQWTGAKARDALLKRGVKVKIFEPVASERYDEYFRVTVGVADENTRFLAELQALFGAEGQTRAAS